jgi:Flp pilus assembly protein TadB
VSEGPVQSLIDRFLALCITFAVAVAVLEWAVIRFMPLLPFVVFGVVIYAFLRWQRR